ncbi:hypothetical protein VOLCADRAFT_93860 [Volvox carteri f. nagariensis]|uniref:Peptidase M43 pregnancy-associated plasma-A domain-containing protein n=1 Tax=Volvox carteri f. nagariensis TaxID=3068 RepID=D8U392_VOLCA|nr:uncharacterized protein VOLCADRAFT_93860 [Volvox carteri f. nagariensis]EFJ45786.1 hypothetical protein VOLCADRAFT_93860 [Volvox carteri f. nagariensis]|eukprot:XP_002953187.1 hypothetical protein VOLCADRAFT_93860 [Volvox carteri f. nagariensis]
MPSAREQLAAIRTEVQANDAPKLTAPHEQREQLDEGTLMLLETAITALDANEPQLAVAGECLKIAHRRLKCYSVALAKAGPGANGNFTAPYEIWHGRRRNFTKPEFKPEAIDKGDIESALAKTRKSVAADRDENLAATVLGALLVTAGFRAPRPAQPPPAQRDNTQVETKNTAKRPAPGPAEPTRPRTKVAHQAQEPHPDPGAPSRNEQAVPEAGTASFLDYPRLAFPSIFAYAWSVWDYPRSVNIFIAGDATYSGFLGFAFAGGSDVDLGRGYVFVSWDSLSMDSSNSPTMYHDGSNTLLHELFHHLGLKHTFAPLDYGSFSTDCYQYDDYVIDTPVSGLATSSMFLYPAAVSYCVELFWGKYGGDWDATYVRWSSTLGIPDTDKNAWADSCPGKPGYDELGNYMTYNTPVCFAALGHFTPAQVQRAHYVTAELNPVLYAWGQYYAQNAAAPPPPLSSTPSVDVCRRLAGPFLQANSC